MQKLSEVYDYVLHYTDWNGLLGILQSQSLWASHYKYLNDYSEIILFRDKLIGLTVPHVNGQYKKLIKNNPLIRKKIRKEGGLKKIVQHDTEVLVNAQYHATGDEIYICSFCGLSPNQYINENGLLSQWRGYGSGGGFALVFNALRLEEMLEQEVKVHRYATMHFSNVVYSDDEENLKDEFSEDLSILAKDIGKVFSLSNNEAKQEGPSFEGFGSFVSCISRYKHHGFKEENEVRIVALPTTNEDEKLLSSIEDIQDSALDSALEKERKFREMRDEKVPYIELFKDIGDNLPIKKIIVGPHKNKDKRVSILRAMLRKQDIEIACSDIPFVE